ncbi:hypothetical protein OXB_1815 [Bacillus sp. OxB-1]|nr:hypothetical protein OXB_1815 [Bacillus sp. OxB-1]
MARAEIVMGALKLSWGGGNCHGKLSNCQGDSLNCHGPSENCHGAVELSC